MTTFTTSRIPSALLADLALAMARTAAVRVLNVFAALKNRKDAALLASFDERMLADIGLTRSDIRDAYSVPMWSDPTAILKNRVGERHRYRRSAPFGLSEQMISPPLVPLHTRLTMDHSAR